MDSMEARQLIHSAGAMLSPVQIVDSIIVPALERIGARWERGEAALSQVYMSGRICEPLVSNLLPIDSHDRKDKPIVGVTVLEDFHVLGKNLVLSALRASGFNPLDLGRTDVGQLIQTVIAENVKVLLISTLMLPSALRVRDVCNGLKAAGYRAKIAVGGAPFRFDPELWREVGADAGGRSAGEAITITRELIQAVERMETTT